MPKKENEIFELLNIMSSLRLRTILISISLAMVVLVVFWRVGGYDFIYYDDGSYVFENSHVLQGWSLDGLKWALTTTKQLHWHPLTWLSLMTDKQFFGLDPGAFHLVNLLIHVLNTLLLFYVLTRMTGAVYCSAFVAALFGLHPLHVEPVAWIADRKDLLNAFFWMTTLWFYFRYVQRPGVSNAVLVFVSFLCSLMTKSMSVTLPLILLVIDYWPLNRFAGHKPEAIPASLQSQAKPASKSVIRKGKKNKNRQSAHASSSEAGSTPTAYPIGRLLTEKAVLFLPMIFGAGITLMIIQRNKLPSYNPLKVLPSLHTLEEAIFAYAKYLYQMVWPAGLAIPYPRVKVFPIWEILLSLFVLLVISFLAYWRRRQNPYLLAGWLWYLITLLPAIGLVQSGPHNQADRYTYVPLVGIFIMIAWGSAEIFAESRHRQWILSGGAAFCILACLTVSWTQVGHWKNTFTIFSHSLRVTQNNFLAHTNLGAKLLESGQTDEAMSHFLEVIRIHPKDKYAQVNLGNAYSQKKDLPKAIDHYKEALSIDPEYVNANFNLANVYLELNKLDLCEKYFLKTIENDKRNYRAHLGLALAYSGMGKSTEAIKHLRECVKIQPDRHSAYYGLGLEYLKLEDPEKAELNFNKVLEIKADFEPAHYYLGIIMMQRKNYDEAIRHFLRALEINPGYKEARQSLEEARTRK
jgi:tetratricopeptide (TPR) repeat protein